MFWDYRNTAGGESPLTFRAFGESEDFRFTRAFELYYCKNNRNYPDINYFNCSNYKGNRGTCPTTHYIRVDFLEQVVLGEIRRMTKFASRYEDEFARLVMGHSQKVVEIDRQAKQRELNALYARDREIDNLFTRMYVDNASGKIDDTRFAKMSRQYADEQAVIAEAMKSIKAELDRKTDKAMTTGAFIAMVRKYTRAKKLTQRMLNELIDKIEVHHADKSSGEHRHLIHNIGIRQGACKIKIPRSNYLRRKSAAIRRWQGRNAYPSTYGFGVRFPAFTASHSFSFYA
jgi:hypothetical protein